MTSRGRWLRKIRFAMVGIIVLAVVDVVLRSEPAERLVAGIVEAGLEALTGEQVTLGDLELNPVTQGLAIKGLVISHETASGLGDPVVAVDELRLRLGLPIDGAWIRNIEVDRPVLSLHIDEDGLREFRDARTRSKRSELPWNRIQINNGRLELDTPVGVLLLEGMNAETNTGDEVDISVQTARLMAGNIDEVARTVRAQSVRFSPNGIAVPHFRLESEHSSASGSLDAEFGGALKGDVTASLAFSVFNPLVTAEQEFEGTAHLDLEFGGTVREPMARGTALVDGFRYSSRKNPDKPVSVVMERMVSPVVWSGRRLKMSGAEAVWGDGTVTIDADVDLVSRGIQVAAVLESVDFRTALRQAGGHRNAWVNFGMDGEFHVAGTVAPLRLAGSVELAAASFEQMSALPGTPKAKTLLSIPAFDLAAGLDLSRDGVWITNAAVSSGSTRGVLDVFFGLGRTGPLDVRFDFEQMDLSLLRPLNEVGLRGVGRVTGGIAGPYKGLSMYSRARLSNFGLAGLYFADQVDLTIRSDDFRTLTFPKFRGRLGSSRYIGEGSMRISSEPQMNMSVEITDGRIGDLVRIGDGSLDWVDGRVAGVVTMVGDPRAMDGEIALDFRDVDLLGEPFPAGSASGWWSGGDIKLDQLHLARWNGEESILVQGTVQKDWTSNLAVAATGFELGRLGAVDELGVDASGKISVDAVVSGNLLEPQPTGRMALREAIFAGKAVPDSTVSFRPHENGIALEGSLVGDGVSFTGLVDSAPGRLFSIDASMAELPLHTVFPVAADGSDVRAHLTGTAQIEGNRVAGETVFGVRGQGRSLSVAWDRHILHTLGPWQFESTGRSMELSGLRMQGPGTDIEWEISSDTTGSLAGGGGGVVDADLARMLVSELERAEGPIAVKVDAGGTIREPEWSIDAALAGVTLQGEWFPHPVEDVYGVVTSNESETRFRRLDFQGVDKQWVATVPLLADKLNELARKDGLHGRIGDGVVVAAGGYQSTEWHPEQYEIQADVTDARVQFIEELPPFKGDASLAFSGPSSEALLSGTIDVNEMVFSERITWEEWMLEFTTEATADVSVEESSPAFSMDILLQSDNTIEVRNNVGDLTAGGELRIVGDTNEPGLVGSIVAVPGGRMHLKEREFELSRGEILYVDPYTFDPELDLVLNTEVRSREDTYDVTYRVGGTLDDWRAETRSDPELPSADVNALLLFGMTRAELERYGGLAGALAVEGGDLLASSFLFSSRDETERGGIFRIVDPLRPELLDLVSGVSERGSGLVNSELRLLYENELSDVGLTGGMMILEQNISRASDTYLGFEQRLARQLYARTYWGSEQVGRFLDVGGAYGLEMKVRWELD